jgi:prepilin signal peptidase PulO-like enzyme (type II secretory pathway)
LLAGGILMLLGRMQRNEALPFGPFLAFSGWMAWVGGERFQEWMTWQSRWWD